MYIEFLYSAEVSIIMKKFLAVAMTAVLLLCALSSCVANLGDKDAINQYTPEIDYYVDEAGNTFHFAEGEGDTAVLTKYNGKATTGDHVVIPEKFNDRVVAAIGDDAFYNLASLESVEIPATVTKIGKHAFAACTELTSITLPAGLLEIGDLAFANCSKLETVVLGDSLETIGDKAFWSCSALKTVALPATLESIGDGAFWGCAALTTLEIPASVTAIGTLAYYNCTGLESIKLHDGITELGDYIFVTNGSTLKDKIDISNLAADSKVLAYVNAIAEPTPETEGETEGETDPAGEK